MSVLERLAEVLDELSRFEVDSSDEIRELMKQRARLDAMTARNVARWDANKTWAADGARTGAAWLAGMCRIDKRHAHRVLRLGRACRRMPATEAAWLTGSIHAEHVSVLATVAEVDGFADDEPELVDKARSKRYAHFVKDIAYWRVKHAGDDADAHAAKQINDRCFDFSQSFQGVWFGDIRADPISGEIINTTLRIIDRELWEQDWTEAKQRLGRDPLAQELRRSPKQRRLDALVEMAVRARVVPENGRRPEPLFTVLVGYEQFQHICELASGTVLPASALAQHLADGWAERIVFESPSRAVDVGVHRRIFTGATRRAVIVRDMLLEDGTCFDTLCDIHAEDCQVDHITPWSQGGLTIQTNGRIACGHHNRLRNKRKPDAE